MSPTERMDAMLEMYRETSLKIDILAKEVRDLVSPLAISLAHHVERLNTLERDVKIVHERVSTHKAEHGSIGTKLFFLLISAVVALAVALVSLWDRLHKGP